MRVLVRIERREEPVNYSLRQNFDPNCGSVSGTAFVHKGCSSEVNLETLHKPSPSDVRDRDITQSWKQW